MRALRRRTPLIIASPAKASPAQRLAVEELASCLGRMYPQTRFVTAGKLPASGKAILVGSDASVRSMIPDADVSTPESYAVRSVRRGNQQLGIIAGADTRGVVYGVYALLEKLGCGFYLSGDALPPAAHGAVLVRRLAAVQRAARARPHRVRLAQLPQRLLDVEPAGVEDVDRAIAEARLQRHHGPRLRQQPDGQLQLQRQDQAGRLSLDNRQGSRLVHDARQRRAPALRRRSVRRAGLRRRRPRRCRTTSAWPRRRNSCTACSPTRSSGGWMSTSPTTWTPFPRIRRS